MEHKWTIKIKDAICDNPEDENPIWTEGETFFTYETREEAYEDVYSLWCEQQGIQFSENEIYVRGPESELARITDEFVLGECEIEQTPKGTYYKMVRVERDFIHDEPRSESMCPGTMVVLQKDKAVILAEAGKCDRKLIDYLRVMCNLQPWKGIKNIELKEK